MPWKNNKNVRKFKVTVIENSLFGFKKMRFHTRNSQFTERAEKRKNARFIKEKYKIDDAVVFLKGS